MSENDLWYVYVGEMGVRSYSLHGGQKYVARTCVNVGYGCDTCSGRVSLWGKEVGYGSLAQKYMLQGEIT
jgi:hypothetical protein